MPTFTNDARAARILAAAAQLIAHYGYDKTTVDDIAREAGVSKGAIYLHWKSKEELLDTLLVQEMQHLLDDFLRRVQEDPAGGTIARMYGHALLALQDNPLMRALYTQDSRVLGDYMRQKGPARYTQRYLFGQEFVRQMQAAGLIRTDQSPEVISYWMTIIAYGFVSVEAIVPASAAPPPAEVAAALTQIVESGLAQPGGDSTAGKEALAAIVESVRQQYRQAASEDKEV